MTKWEDRQTKKDTGAGGLVRCIEGQQGSRARLMSPMTGPDNGPYRTFHIAVAKEQRARAANAHDKVLQRENAAVGVFQMDNPVIDMPLAGLGFFGCSSLQAGQDGIGPGAPLKPFLTRILAPTRPDKHLIQGTTTVLLAQCFLKHCYLQLRNLVVGSRRGFRGQGKQTAERKKMSEWVTRWSLRRQNCWRAL